MGELAALLTACCWAISSLFFSAASQRLGSVVVNRMRLLFGVILLALAHQPPERDMLERSLARSGFPVESRTGHTIYLRDPEGNRVAVSSYPLPATP